MRSITDISRFVCQPGVPLRDVMQRFNDLPERFMVVVDPAGKPLGTITDGDLRRGILRGLSLDTPVSVAMNTSPVIGRRSDPKAVSMQSLNRVGFLPMVDASGSLCDIRLPSGQIEPVLDALVMAGGFGRRLGDRTLRTPKPMLEVGDKPMLEHMLTWLEDGGVRRIFVSVHYLSEQIEAYLANRKGAAEHEILRETNPLGTAGAAGFLAGRVKKPFLVANADVITRLDLASLTAFHHSHGHDGTLAVVPHVVDIPFGVIKQDDAGNFEGIDEKPRYSYFVSSGIYLLSPEFCNLVPQGQPFDMPDLLIAGRKAGLRIGVFPIHEYWRDLGREADLQSARIENS